MMGLSGTTPAMEHSVLIRRMSGAIAGYFFSDARYATSASMFSFGIEAYFAGIAGFRVALCFAAIPAGSVIHCRSSSALKVEPTPSSDPFALPLPAIE